MGPMCQKCESWPNTGGFPLNDVCLNGNCKKVWKIWRSRGGPSRFCVFPVNCPKIQWKMDEKTLMAFFEHFLSTFVDSE